MTREGSGKTFTAVNWLLNSGVANGYKIVWLVHRQDLITQTYNEFRNQAPVLAKYDIKKLRIIPISGIHYKVSQASRYDVNICSIGSIANKFGYRFIRRMLGANGMRRVIVVIDEAHHAVAPSYRKVINRITELNPKRILLGLTATPVRMQERDHKKLMRIFNVDKNLQDNIGNKKGYIYEITLKSLLINGSLAKPIYKRIDTKIVGDIEYSLTQEDEDFFNQFGELSEHIKENKFKVLINVQILTEGSDVPDIQTIFLTRQTNSDSLLMQMIGRKLRGIDYGGTKEAYIIDFHDTWDKFNFWLDPKQLDVFTDTADEKDSDKDQVIEEIIDEELLENGEIQLIHPDPDLFDIYSRIYNKIRSKVILDSSRWLSSTG